jgi:hypothetical protein
MKKRDYRIYGLTREQLYLIKAYIEADYKHDDLQGIFTDGDGKLYVLIRYTWWDVVRYWFATIRIRITTKQRLRLKRH